ncbi:MAG: hypothetical protein ABIJ21_05800 [Nanoarchaeota archaeon]
MAKYVAETSVVSIDFDGVLALGWPVKMKYAKEWFGVSLSLSQTKKEGFEALMQSKGKPEITYRSLMDPLNEKHILEYVVPEGCIQALGELYQKGFRFAVVTSRNDHDLSYTRAFLKERFGNLIKYVHNTRDEPKGRFVSRLKPRAHIDDDLQKLVAIANLPVELVYFRQPENAHENQFEKNRIVEIDEWMNIKQFLERVKFIHEAICWKYGLDNNYRNIHEIFGIKQNLSDGKVVELLKEYGFH